ncbi:MAG: hypothetical protein ACK416_04845 [Zestosphaera sp.]
MQTRRSVRNIKEANELFKELSNTMECGERVKVMIKNVGEVQKYVEIIIKYGLSLIDIEEVNNDYYLVIENRFSVRCA